MRGRTIAMVMLLAGLATAPPVAAAEPACAGAIDAALPAAWTDWSGDAAAATDLLPLGAARIVRLTPDAAFTTPPERAPAKGSAGATVRFSVAEGARYGVALDGKGWIDVVRDGPTIASVAHGHGSACSSIAKLVHFTLEPGDYVLQLSGAGSATIKVMVARD